MSSNVSQMTWDAFFSGATEITQNTLLATNPIIQSGFQNQDKQQVFNKELNKKHDLILMRKDHTFNKGKRGFCWFFLLRTITYDTSISLIQYMPKIEKANTFAPHINVCECDREISIGCPFGNAKPSTSFHFVVYKRSGFTISQNCKKNEWKLVLRQQRPSLLTVLCIQ